MERIKTAALSAGLALLLITVSCGQVDPIELVGKFKGKRAERVSRLIAKVVGLRTGEHEVKLTKNVMVPMRDGMKLATDVYMPMPEGQYPVITCRLPYEKKNMAAVGYIIASNGYVFAVQDVRATGESEGDNFIPVVSDHSDGHDFIDWIKRQSWYNGKIGSWGASFLGRTQWLVSDSPDMDCIYPQYTSTDFAARYRGGAYMHEAITFWAANTGHKGGETQEASREELKEQLDEKIMKTGYYNQPLERPWMVEPKEIAGKSLDGMLELLGDRLGERVRWNGPGYSEETMMKMRDLLINPGFAEATMGYTDRLERHRNMKPPALLVSGWYDVHNPATMEDLVNIKKYASGDARKYSRLIVGPWAHVMPGGRDVPRHGDNAARSFEVYKSLFYFDWWDYWLKGVENGYPQRAPLRIYVMGKNYWRDEREWPLGRTEWTKYYLHSGGDANSLEGDGSLSTKAPGNEQPDEYDYDPHYPVPTRGGAKLLQPSGAMLQNEVQRREDVLVYTSEPLEEDTEVTGPLKAVIYASSSAVDTDYVVKLTDVQPDGDAMLINDGIQRARFRNGLDNPSLIEPGKIYRYEISLWATSNVFLEGHRIRVEVSSSNFPRYDRNANLGGKSGEPVVAHQKIYHDSEHPSHVVLPVIP